MSCAARYPKLRVLRPGMSGDPCPGRLTPCSRGGGWIDPEAGRVPLVDYAAAWISADDAV